MRGSISAGSASGCWSRRGSTARITAATAAGRRSVNYGAVLPWWDMLFGTADFSPVYAATGDPTAEEALATGSYAAQQWAALRRMFR